MGLFGGFALLAYIEPILRICMYFSIIVVAVKGSQALNIYIKKNNRF